jgi:hypothetical protein
VAKDLGFADRLAYIRLIRWLYSGARAPETDGEFAEAMGVTPGWLAKWKTRDDTPDRRTETTAISTALSAMGVKADWLLDNRGEPPRADLWETWSRARKRAPNMAGFAMLGEKAAAKKTAS